MPEPEPQIIAQVGQAKLIKELVGTGWTKKYSLVGGTQEDRSELRKWIEKFMPGTKVDED